MDTEQTQRKSMPSKISVDNPDEVEIGEMMPLCDQLGTDDDIEPPGRHLCEFLAQALDGLNEIARKHQDAAFWKQLPRLGFEPLDAGTDRHPRPARETMRTLHRQRHGVAAVMADEAVAESMLDKPGVAVGTTETKPALPAQRERGEAAAV